MKKSIVQDAFFVGVAIFSIIFGAGNLIFPSYVGLKQSENWIVAFCGFITTDVVLAILGFCALMKAGCSPKKLTDKVHPIFSIVFGVVIILILGPFLAIPRTCSVAYEIGIEPIVNMASYKWIFVCLYFLAVCLFCLNRSKVISNLVKFLSPLFLLALVYVIASAIIHPLGDYIAPLTSTPAYLFGFFEGYKTADGIATFIIVATVVSAISSRGYVDEKSQMKVFILGSVVAGGILAVFYGGLIYIGARSGTAFSVDVERTALLSGIAYKTLGEYGGVLFGVAVFLTTFTTAIGVTTGVAVYVDELFEKISYRVAVIGIAFVSALFAMIRVDEIVALITPLLDIVYPISIFLFFAVVFFDSSIKNNKVYIIPILVITLFCLPSLILSFIDIKPLNDLMSVFPLYESGFVWVIPTTIVFVLSYFYYKIKRDVTLPTFR